MAERLTFEQSCAVLREQGWLSATEYPKMPSRPPRYDDAALGVNFFRTQVKGAKFQRLTIPRTFISRSEIADSSFADCDLSESVMNWNDFEDVDFVAASLKACDLRSCNFHKVNFKKASLKEADLRHCRFESCDFTAADLTGVKLSRSWRTALALSKEQVAAIDWQTTDGPEPAGG